MDALLFLEGLGHNANGRSLVMTPEFINERGQQAVELPGESFGVPLGEEEEAFFFFFGEWTPWNKQPTLSILSQHGALRRAAAGAAAQLVVRRGVWAHTRRGLSSPDAHATRHGRRPSVWPQAALGTWGAPGEGGAAC